MEELPQKWGKMKEQGKRAKMEHKWARSGEKWGNYQSKMVKCGRNQHTQQHPSAPSTILACTTGLLAQFQYGLPLPQCPVLPL